MRYARFVVDGIGPATDPAWIAAKKDARRAFWSMVVAITLDVKDQELAAGLDRFGQPLRPIAARTRRHRRSAMGAADPNAPPLTPAHGLSRTRSLLRGRALANSAEFYWAFDEYTGASWGKILTYHAQGRGRLPIRDVIGISDASRAEIERRALVWWSHYKHGVKVVPQVTKLKFNVPSVAVNPVIPKPAKLKIAPVGRTDLANYTMMSGSKTAVKRGVAAGAFSGFITREERKALTKALK